MFSHGRGIASAQCEESSRNLLSLCLQVMRHCQLLHLMQTKLGTGWQCELGIIKLEKELLWHATMCLKVVAKYPGTKYRSQG